MGGQARASHGLPPGDLTLRMSGQGVPGQADLPDNVVPAGGGTGSQSCAGLCGELRTPPPAQFGGPVGSREADAPLTRRSLLEQDPRPSRRPCLLDPLVGMCHASAHGWTHVPTPAEQALRVLQLAAPSAPALVFLHAHAYGAG